MRKENDYLETEIASKHATLQELYADINKAEKRCKGLTTMIRNLEKQEKDMKGQLSRLQKELASGNGNVTDLNRQIMELEERLRDTKSSLIDKRQKLNIADRQLSSLKQEMDSLRQTTDNLQRQKSELTEDVKTQIRMRLTDAVFAKAFVELNRLIDYLTPEQKAQFGNEFLMHLAEQPAQIVNCAMLLFAGYIDGAIQFAQGSGGGGGSTSDLKWGRDPGEDDRKFAFRCMMQAHRMMRPAPTKQVKR